MEKTHVIVDGTELQIPLKALQQYGVEPGAHVAIEFGPNCILPAIYFSQTGECLPELSTRFDLMLIPV